MVVPGPGESQENLVSQPGDYAADPCGWDLKASLDRLARLGQQRSYRTGTILINQGDEGGTLFVILSGSVRAYVEGPSGRILTLSTYVEDEYVGEMALDGGPRSASIITLEPTKCSVVSTKDLRKHIHAEPDFAIDMMMRLIQRARIATESARGLALLDVYGRIRELLEQLADTLEDGSRQTRVRLTHKEIADRVGASREMVSKILKELVVGGYIEIDRRQIRILRGLPAGW